jgi:hypothetical protein
MPVRRIEQPSDRGGGPPLNVTVGVVSVQAIRENPRRRRLIFTNDSDTVIYLARYQRAVLNAGIRLNANGGGFVDEPDNTGYMYTGPWHTISSAANKNLCVSEDH